MKWLRLIAAAVINLIAAVCAVFAGDILRGWAISMLWRWFLVPLGLPTISLWHGYGIVLLAWAATHDWRAARIPAPRTTRGAVVELLSDAGSTLLLVVVGWVVYTLWM